MLKQPEPAVDPARFDLSPMLMNGNVPQPGAAGAPARIRRALSLLQQGRQYSQQLQCDLWDFSVEVSALRELGVTRNDLRWLVCNGLVEHARETTHFGDDRREFRPAGRLNLVRRSCFVLTPSGAELAERLAALDDLARPAPAPDDSGVSRVPLRPVWDRQRREFRLGSEVLKRFKLPSRNQETILTAFEEEGWPPRIDDPLPPAVDCDPRQRLRDTIKSLNRNRRAARVRFKGDGTAQGVLWELTSGSTDAGPCIAP